MSGKVETAEFTAVFKIQAVMMPDPAGLHRVPPIAPNNTVTFDVNELHVDDPSSAILRDNKNIALLNEVIAAWTQQFSHASNRLINDLVAHDDRRPPRPPHGGE